MRAPKARKRRGPDPGRRAVVDCVHAGEAVKIYMHWDMEGCSGLFHKDQAWYWYPHVPESTKEEGRQLLMADINNAVKAALAAGAERVIICDTHHGGGNIRIPELSQDFRVTYYDQSTRE